MERYENDYYCLEFSSEIETLVYSAKDFHIGDKSLQAVDDTVHAIKRWKPKFFITDVTNISVVSGEDVGYLLDHLMPELKKYKLEPVYIIPPITELGAVFLDLMVSKADQLGWEPSVVHCDSLEDAKQRISQMRSAS